jgi:carbon monoxide dehydrogenase subunit G
LGKATGGIEIKASPEKVFAFLLDDKKFNEITKGNLEREQTSKGPAGVGSTSHWVGTAGGNQQEFDMECTEFVKNKKLVTRTIGASKFKMTASYALEPTAKGTKFAYSMDYELPYSVLGKLIDKLKVGKEMEKNIGAMLENLKRALET